MLCKHAEIAKMMGVSPKNIVIAENGSVIEFGKRGIKKEASVPAGAVYVDGKSVGDVGVAVLRDRRHLAEDGMVMAIVTLSADDGSVAAPPEIITRGFIYVKDSDDLMEELRRVVNESLESCDRHRVREWSAIKSRIKSNISGYLYKTTRRSPMVLPVIIEV